MAKLSAFLLLAVVAHASCDNPVMKSVYMPGFACGDLHYDFWANLATEKNSGITAVAYAVSAFTDYDKEIYLRHNEASNKGKTNIFHFELYKPVGSSAESTSGRKRVSEPEKEQSERPSGLFLTENELVDLFKKKLKQGKKFVLKWKDIATAFTEKENSGTEAMTTSIFRKLSKLAKEELINNLYGQKPDEKNLKNALDGLKSSGSEEKEDTLEMMSYDQRPKLKGIKDKNTSEYALRAIKIEMSPEVYNLKYQYPMHVTVTLEFDQGDKKDVSLLVIYPIFASVEEIGPVPSLNDFFKYLAENRNIKTEALPRKLDFLIPAMNDLDSDFFEAYEDASKRIILVSPCQFIDEQILRDLFIAHPVQSVDLSAQISDVLPTESYTRQPKA